MGLISRSWGSQQWSFTLKSLLMVWLSLCVEPTSGQGSDVAATVGETVTLSAPVTGILISGIWYRGSSANDQQKILTYVPVDSPPQSNGPQYSGRETGLSTGALQIRDVRTTDTGNYFVSIVLSGGASGTAIRNLTVYENVSIPVIHPVPQNPIENGSLALFCNASGTQVSYRWYKKDTEVVAGGRISLTSNGQNLTLSPCTRSDTGTNFTCRASNAVSNASSSPYTVTISYGPATPVISVSPEKPVYAVGSALTLSCTADSHPLAQYTWLLSGRSLQNTGQQLYINSLSLSDNGTYTCNASNSVTHLYNSANRDIHIMENVTEPTVQYNKSQLVENRGPAVITCDASSAAVTILWFFNDNPVLPDIRMSLSADNRTLTISNVSRSDSGIYQCKAINPVSSSMSKPQTLTVAYGPLNVTIQPPGPETLQAGTTLTLTCTAESSPDPQYRWFLNTTDLKKEQKILTVQTVYSKDEGNYTCVAYNTLTGLSPNASVYITVNGTDISNRNSLPDWAIAVIVVVVLAVCAVIAFLVYWFKFRKPAAGTSNSVPMDTTKQKPETSTNAKPNGTADDVQYSSVSFVPKAAAPAKPATNENTVYSEVRR